MLFSSYIWEDNMLKFSDRQMSLINYYLGKADNTSPIIYGNDVREVFKTILAVKRSNPYSPISRSDDTLRFNRKGVAVTINYKQCSVTIERDINTKLEVTSTIYNRISEQKFLDRNVWKSSTRIEHYKAMEPIRLQAEVNKLINSETTT